ncbi:MAG: methyltransferase [Balneolia bacterium]|nr:methyltransferase [Balneolia bacterium]
MGDFSKPSTISISCPKQLAPYLKSEAEALGFSPDSMRETGIDITGSLNDCIRLNLELRTAHRIHYLLDETKASDPDQLYKWLMTIPWEDWIPANGYVAVTSRVNHPTITNTQYANLKVKDAIVDRMREKTGRRPDAGSDLNRTVVFLFWDTKQARIFLDTSGESLSRRGYRVENTEAPMQESLGAALVMATGWKPDQHFINPMCGSGTLAIEAAMSGLAIEPGSRRRGFGFLHIKGFDRTVYKEERLRLRAARKELTGGRIIATDHDERSVAAARANAEAAGVDHLIEFHVCDFSETDVPEGDGVIIMNPPYGERMGNKQELAATYNEIGTWFKHKCTGKTGFVFTGDVPLSRKVGLKPFKNLLFYNTTIECRLLAYELY